MMRRARIAIDRARGPRAGGRGGGEPLGAVSAGGMLGPTGSAAAGLGLLVVGGRWVAPGPRPRPGSSRGRLGGLDLLAQRLAAAAAAGLALGAPALALARLLVLGEGVVPVGSSVIGSLPTGEIGLEQVGRGERVRGRLAPPRAVSAAIRVVRRSS